MTDYDSYKCQGNTLENVLEQHQHEKKESYTKRFLNMWKRFKALAYLVYGMPHLGVGGNKGVKEEDGLPPYEEVANRLIGDGGILLGKDLPVSGEV